MNIVEYRNFGISFKSGEEELIAVNDISFNIKAGEIIGIVGESGSGKTVTAMSLMQLILSDEKTQTGEINFEGKNILSLEEEELEKIRGVKIGAIYQDPLSSLNPVYTVGKQIIEGLVKKKHLSKNEAKEKALEILKKVGISEGEKVYDSYPNELSGGMRQRVLIAMAISLEPKILIADEPTTALDVTIQAQILELIREINKNLNMSIMVITHDFGVVAELCDYVVVMYGGKIVEEGDVFTIFDEPKHPYTKALLESRPSIDLDFTGVKELKVIKGSVEVQRKQPVKCLFYNRCDEKVKVCEDKGLPKLINLNNNHKVACHLCKDEVDYE